MSVWVLRDKFFGRAQHAPLMDKMGWLNQWLIKLTHYNWMHIHLSVLFQYFLSINLNSKKNTKLWFLYCLVLSCVPCWVVELTRYPYKSFRWPSLLSCFWAEYPWGWSHKMTQSIGQPMWINGSMYVLIYNNWWPGIPFCYIPFCYVFLGNVEHHRARRP
jgi:hypothetical protein